MRRQEYIVFCEKARIVFCEKARIVFCEKARIVFCEKAKIVFCEKARIVFCEKARIVFCERARRSLKGKSAERLLCPPSFSPACRPASHNRESRQKEKSPFSTQTFSPKEYPYFSNF